MVQDAGTPQDAEALAAMAFAHFDAGRPAEALAAIRAIEATAWLGPQACRTLGLIAMGADASVEALAWFDKAVAQDPLAADLAAIRATLLAKLDHLDEAVAGFDAAVAAGCADPAAHYAHGTVLRRLGRLDEAIAAFDRALRLKPAYPEALRAGGAILRERGHLEGALRFFAEALRLKPDDLDAVLDLANLLQAMERLDDALAVLDAALLYRPVNALLLNNRGVTLHFLGRLDAAAACLAAAIAADPTLAPAHLNKGQVDLRFGRNAEALVSFETALALRSPYPEAACSRGVALKMLGRFDEAMAAFDSVLAADPDDAYARCNRGELRLLMGDYAQGWPDYESRFLTRRHKKPVLRWPVPEWRGEREPGRVVVLADQAVGDIIHFARYLPALRAAGADVTFVCRPRMQRLLRPVCRGIRVLDALNAPEPFDYQIPLSNIPFACRTTLANMPRAAYLRAEPELVEQFKPIVGTDGLRIGLCWRGGQNFLSDPKRSVPLAALAPLSTVPGVRLFSLQMADNPGPDHAAYAAMRFAPLPALDQGADSFVETAALMANLDLVVTCDTSIAHLAGALGRPTLVVLQNVPEWRFMLGREDSPWYPSMRLFRQDRPDDWSAPIERMIASLPMAGQREG